MLLVYNIIIIISDSQARLTAAGTQTSSSLYYCRRIGSGLQLSLLTAWVKEALALLSLTNSALLVCIPIAY
jgi:hypothetical protein